MGVISTVVCVFGLLGNVFAVIVLCGPKMKSAFNQLLIALCAFDTVFILCNIGVCVSTLGVKAGEGND